MPETPSRRAAYEAVYEVIRGLDAFMPRDSAHRNAIIWRAVHAALDAAAGDRRAVLVAAINRVKAIPVECAVPTFTVWYGQGWADAIHELEEIADYGSENGDRLAVTGSPAACRSTRHCAVHGWCHRCDPERADLRSRVLEAIRYALVPTGPWGPEMDAAALAVLAVLPTPAALAADTDMESPS